MHQASLRSGWLLVLTASLVYVVAVLQRSSLGVRTTEAAERFGLSDASVAYLPAISLLVYALTQIPVGLALDRLGPRAVALAAIACLATGSLALGLATGQVSAGLARLLLGLGDACTFLTVLRVAATSLPPSQFGVASAVGNASGAFGQLLGTFPLTYLLNDLGWAAGFSTVAAVTLVLAVPVLTWSRGTGETAATATSAAGTAIGWELPVACLGHAMLMGQFLCFTIMWGHPYLTSTLGLSPDLATAAIAVAVVAFGCSSVAQTVGGGRAAPTPSTIVRAGVVVTSAWLLLAVCGSTAPDLLAFAVAVVSGWAASLVSVAFALGRWGAPGDRVALRSGIVNGCSFFSTAVLLVVVRWVQPSASRHDALPWVLVVVLTVFVLALAVLAALRSARVRR